MEKRVLSCGFARNYKGCRMYIVITSGWNTWEDMHADILIRVAKSGRYINNLEFGLFGYTIREANKKARERAHEYIDNLILKYAN